MRHAPPPPVPQRLREMLKDYPDHIQKLQAALNHVAEKPSTGIPVIEQAIWALEDTLERFALDAGKETKVAEANGDPLAVEQATARESLMFRAASKTVWVGDRELSEYFRAPGKFSL
ncbi:hypothetical protein [Stenotrophomonas sp.]|uniref:hypothetical protein n=1 Tax=Stenotrophomonas sp. TaxID=69392 RepID=UPI0028B24B52|nr:hypothetical protein [Stenotrophomonas sp.]